jgi:hypothetical protein
MDEAMKVVEMGRKKSEDESVDKRSRWVEWQAGNEARVTAKVPEQLGLNP